MVRYFLQSIMNELMDNEYLKGLDGTARDYDRKVYIEGGEYQEYGIELVFRVDTENWYKETIGFTISINSFSNKVEISRHISLERREFSRRPARAISDYIAKEVMNFQCKREHYIERKIM